MQSASCQGAEQHGGKCLAKYRSCARVCQGRAVGLWGQLVSTWRSEARHPVLVIICGTSHTHMTPDHGAQGGGTAVSPDVPLGFGGPSTAASPGSRSSSVSSPPSPSAGLLCPTRMATTSSAIPTCGRRHYTSSEIEICVACLSLHSSMLAMLSQQLVALLGGTVAMQGRVCMHQKVADVALISTFARRYQPSPKPQTTFHSQIRMKSNHISCVAAYGPRSLFLCGCEEAEASPVARCRHSCPADCSHS